MADKRSGCRLLPMVFSFFGSVRGQEKETNNIENNLNNIKPARTVRVLFDAPGPDFQNYVLNTFNRGFSSLVLLLRFGETLYFLTVAVDYTQPHVRARAIIRSHWRRLL